MWSWLNRSRGTGPPNTHAHGRFEWVPTSRLIQCRPFASRRTVPAPSSAGSSARLMTSSLQKSNTRTVAPSSVVMVAGSNVVRSLR